MKVTWNWFLKNINVIPFTEIDYSPQFGWDLAISPRWFCSHWVEDHQNKTKQWLTQFPCLCSIEWKVTCVTPANIDAVPFTQKYCFPINSMWLIHFPKLFLLKSSGSSSKIKSNSIFHSVYFYQHGCYSITETDCLLNVFGCSLSSSANCFCSSWVEVHQVKKNTVTFIVFPWFFIEWKLTCDLCMATWTIPSLKKLISHNWDVTYPFLQTVFDQVEWKFIKIKENSDFCSFSFIAP